MSKAGAGSLRAHFLDRFGRKFWIASGGRSGRKLLSSAGVVLGSTEKYFVVLKWYGVVLCSTE